MPEDSEKERARVGQADLDGLRPTLARIARVAKTMFAAPLPSRCLRAFGPSHPRQQKQV